MVRRAVCASCSHPVEEGACHTCRALLRDLDDQRRATSVKLLAAAALLLALLVALHLLG